MDSYTNILVIKTTPQYLYDACTTKEGLTSWWTKQTEIYPLVGGTATFHFRNTEYVVMKIAKLISNKKVIWKCVEQHFPTKDTDKTDEWVGTTVKFEFMDNNDGTTTLTFTHEGLTPGLFCYQESNDGWNHFLKSLKLYLETGKGTPYKEEKKNEHA